VFETDGWELCAAALFFTSPLARFSFLFFTGASRDARRSGESAQASENRGRRAEPKAREREEKASNSSRWRISLPLLALSLFLP